MHSKQTKIICTIADNNCEPEFIRSLFESGMNVARINTAHLTPEGAATVISNIRGISNRIGIFVDTKGPEVRSADIETPIVVKTGDIVRITNTPSAANEFAVNYAGFPTEIPAGSQILIDDGETELTVTEAADGVLTCKVENDGVIKNRKSLNVPGVHLDLPSLTEKDTNFINWATKNGIDFIAHSFVRNRADVQAIQDILDANDSDIKIIAKIENREGVNNLEEILDVAHAVMVARGDLGIEIPAAEVPCIQKEMIRTCIRRKKPVITATQMLHTMIENPRATRAEVSDVANAILDGTDAVMLSGESAYGKFPQQAVQTMRDIAYVVESKRAALSVGEDTTEISESKQVENNLAKAAVACAGQLPVQAIVTSTRTGATALSCASHRPLAPIFALSEKESTVRELSLSYGVYAAQIDLPSSTDELVKVCLEKLIEENKIDSDKLVAFLGGSHINSDHTNFMQIETPATLLSK